MISLLRRTISLNPLVALSGQSANEQCYYNTSSSVTWTNESYDGFPRHPIRSYIHIYQSLVPVASPLTMPSSSCLSRIGPLHQAQSKVPYILDLRLRRHPRLEPLRPFCSCHRCRLPWSRSRTWPRRESRT